MIVFSSSFSYLFQLPVLPVWRAGLLMMCFNCRHHWNFDCAVLSLHALYVLNPYTSIDSGIGCCRHEHNVLRNIAGYSKKRVP